MVTELKKPIKRRIGRMVVLIHDWGLEIRAYRSRKAKRVTWEQVASLADEGEPIFRAEELNRGGRVLAALGIVPEKSS